MQPFGARKTLDSWESFSSSVKYILFVTCLRGLTSEKCHFFSSWNVNVHSRWYRHKPQFLFSPQWRFLNVEWESFWEMDFLVNKALLYFQKWRVLLIAFTSFSTVSPFLAMWVCSKHLNSHWSLVAILFSWMPLWVWRHFAFTQNVCHLHSVRIFSSQATLPTRTSHYTEGGHAISTLGPSQIILPPKNVHQWRGK